MYTMAPKPSNRLELNRLAYFAAVVDAGAFTRAAERLGVTKAVVSQQVARLEEELGVTLLLRTTRKLALTEAGRKLHTRCLTILRESAEALVELAEGAEEPSGVLRTTAPVDYGSAVVIPVVASFSRTYPRCSVHVSLTDRIVDVQTVDLAVRVGWLRDSSHIARRIGVMEQYLVCSRELAGELGPVREPEDLAALPFVANLSLPRRLCGTSRTRGAAAASRACKRGSPSMSRPRSTQPYWQAVACRCCRTTPSPPISGRGGWCVCCRSGSCAAAASTPSFLPPGFARPRSAAFSNC
jgi:DNA-binding transcriptional LysR family regulator